MCGIFGLVHNSEANAGKIFHDLCLISESRGKEASGFARRMDESINVLRIPYPASKLVKTNVFKKEILQAESLSGKVFSAIGHSRLVTDGYEHYAENNQPVVKNGFVIVHNGIIVNSKQLWQKFGIENKMSDLDSELIPTILYYYIQLGLDFGSSISKLFSEIYGVANIAMFSEKYSNLILATNNGSIYYIDDIANGLFVFASERFFLVEMIRRNRLSKSIGQIKQLKSGNFISVNIAKSTSCLKRIGDTFDNISFSDQKVTTNILKETHTNGIYVNKSLGTCGSIVPDGFLNLVNERKVRISKLRRCTRCVLPETFPYIEFDDHGECNYCRNYIKHEYKGTEALLKLVGSFRRKDAQNECLIPFSGGRDSSFVLHFVVKELGLKPVAFSYDWGMITDLARRNQSRLCGKLGVEHILVSADIRKKRDNIKRNVLAWLRKPVLGTVPLFMAGDKQYFHFANLLMKQNNLSLSILGENKLENTNFKSGFCGIKPNFRKKNTYSLSVYDKIKMSAFYGYQFLTNPGYINSSVLDTLDAFRSYYLIRHNNVNIYDYIKWDERKIIDILLKEYDWETDPGTMATWRIGDGTSAFYNFIYYTIGGFTENDTFRSNQVREGDLSREEAIHLVNKENEPRWDSIFWYCRTIGIDFPAAINIILMTNTIYGEV